MLQFILNNQHIITELAAGSTVLDFVRYHKMLKGTKIGCREGDCGACTLLVGDFEKDQLVYRSVTSCLMPLGNAQGKHIVSVEGINMEALSPVQQALVETNGTQCGFCTLGFVMSFTGFVLTSKQHTYEQAIAAVDGNICRCTGYKSIERSAKIICDQLSAKPVTQTMPWLVENKFLPPYFASIEARLRTLRNNLVAGPSTNGLAPKMPLGGGTDLIVQKPLVVKRSPVELLLDASHLKTIAIIDNECHIGASVTVTEFVESPIIQQALPEVNKFIKLVSSTPIRNMATLAGNIINASPIGDMSIFFLALDASLVLRDAGNARTVKLKEFYKGYKQLDKQTTEQIETIIFQMPAAGVAFNFEKVCKRMYLDIASVNSACSISLTNNRVSTIHLSAGGVAPFPKYLFNTCAYLQGKEITTNVLKHAIEIMNDEIAPISDVRGTEAYKRFLLRQLLLAHLQQCTPAPNAIKQVLFA